MLSPVWASFPRKEVCDLRSGCAHRYQHRDADNRGAATNGQTKLIEDLWTPYRAREYGRYWPDFRWRFSDVSARCWMRSNGIPDHKVLIVGGGIARSRLSPLSHKRRNFTRGL